VKARILIITEQYWPEGSGGILATHLITGLLKEFAEVTILTGTKNPAKYANVQYLYTPLLNVRVKSILWTNLLRSNSRDWLEKLIEQGDVVYIPRLSYPVAPLAKKLGKKVVAHLHDYQPISYNSVIFYGRGRSSPSLADTIKFEVLEHDSVLRTLGALTAPLNSLSRLWLSQADIIICVSNRQAEIISNLAPELARKIKVIYNPLPEVPPLEKKFERPAFTYSGGDSYVKGFHIFMRGALKILRRWSDVKFVLTGGSRSFGQKHDELVKRLNDAFTGKFRLLGRLPYKDVLRLYSRSHAILVPSLYEEPLPYVVMEAMAMGTIPVASKVGGIPEIVGGTPAEKMLFEASDVDGFVDKMESVLAMSGEQVADVGFALRDAALKKFNSEVVKRELMKMFSP
jgi:glycosyltransferase involved in cell wall biosynthesis